MGDEGKCTTARHNLQAQKTSPRSQVRKLNTCVQVQYDDFLRECWERFHTVVSGRVSPKHLHCQRNLLRSIRDVGKQP